MAVWNTKKTAEFLGITRRHLLRLETLSPMVPADNTSPLWWDVRAVNPNISQTAKKKMVIPFVIC
jgi:hypothetical protein